MPRLELTLDLEPTEPPELGMSCWCCGRYGCEWKFQLSWAPGVWRGLHTKCKIAIEQKRRPSQMLEAVKPP
jgi:hypothetical protein